MGGRKTWCPRLTPPSPEQAQLGLTPAAGGRAWLGCEARCKGSYTKMRLDNEVSAGLESNMKAPRWANSQRERTVSLVESAQPGEDTLPGLKSPEGKGQARPAWLKKWSQSLHIKNFPNNLNYRK